EPLTDGVRAVAGCSGFHFGPKAAAFGKRRDVVFEPQTEELGVKRHETHRRARLEPLSILVVDVQAENSVHGSDIPHPKLAQLVETRAGEEREQRIPAAMVVHENVARLVDSGVAGAAGVERSTVDPLEVVERK